MEKYCTWKIKDDRGFQKKGSCILVYFLRTELKKRQEPERPSIRPCHVDLAQEYFHWKVMQFLSW